MTREQRRANATSAAVGQAAVTRTARGSPALDPLLETALRHHRAGHLAEAENAYRTILRSNPEHAESLHHLGVVAAQRGHLEIAVALIGQALALNDANHEAHNNIGLAHYFEGRLDEARAHFLRAIELEPSYVDPHVSLANLYMRQGEAEKAEAHYRRALGFRADHPEANCSFGILLEAQGEYDEAEARYRRAVAARPDFAQAYLNLGNVLHRRLEHEEALASYAKALAIRPDHADVHVNEALTRLRIGDFAEGFRKYEWRWRKPDVAALRRDFAQPLWLGDAPLAGRAILLHAEQGFGDTLQFIRYAPLLAEQGAHVILEVQPALKTLCAGIDGVGTVIARGDPLPPFDLHCPLLSLPLAFKTDLDTIPASIPYLRPPSERIAKWRERLRRQKPLVIGIAWAGSASFAADRHRSLTLGHLAPLLSSPDIQFVSLQREVGATDQLMLAATPQFWHIGAALEDFADTAAVLSMVDAVVSVDTAVAHLAGALGKPVLLLLPYSPDFRWMLDRSGSPWYPTFKLIRQLRHDDWDTVIDKVREALDTMVAERPAGQEAGRTPGLDQLLDAALRLHHAGRLVEAERLYRIILGSDPQHVGGLHHLGVVSAQAGRHDVAIDLIGKALALNERSHEAHHNIGLAHHLDGRHDAALAHLLRAIELEPDYVDAHVSLAGLYRKQGEPEKAEAHYRRALVLQPDHAEANYNFGIMLEAQGHWDEAEARYRLALTAKPDHARAHLNLGNVLERRHAHGEALACFDEALEIKPDYAEALSNRGNALRALQRPEEALASTDRALAIQPDNAEVLNNRGLALWDLKRFEDALDSYDRALAIKPDFTAALTNRGIVLWELQRFGQAIETYDQALAITPDHAELLYMRGAMHAERQHDETAILDFERALGIDPHLKYIRGQLLRAKTRCCDWRSFADDVERVTADARAEKYACNPFALLGVSDAVRDQLACARTWVRDKCPAVGAEGPAPAALVCNGERSGHERIRVAYLSADFRDHPVARLMAGVLERHDRRRFETFALSFGPEGPSEMRSRLEGAFEHFIDVRRHGDRAVADRMRELEIDIAVDLTGFTQSARTGIFALKPAPVQVGYLGYPATMGADYIDYIIADRFVIPEQSRGGYAEQIVYLPDSFQANDSTRRIDASGLTRAGAGLPDNGFVFCSFNNNYKITPSMFDIWMRLVRAVEGSVLWLLTSNAAMERNLRREAEQRGVAADRLVFAPRVPHAQYLARYQMADLFLDTSPFNAGTTASDALWAGLPLVTLAGEAFAARMAGSLLHAAGSPELVTHSPADYEALALTLARDPGSLAAVKAKLARNRATCPLFDTDRFRRHLESAYVTMWERHKRGEPPADFAVEPIPDIAAERPHRPEGPGMAGGQRAAGTSETASAPAPTPIADDPGLAQMLEAALRLHRTGQLTEAESLFRTILGSDPQHTESLHYLGVIAAQTGRRDIAIDLIGRALALDERSHEAHHNIGLAYHLEGHQDEALRHFLRAIALEPDYVDAHVSLAGLYKRQGELDKAAAHYRQALGLEENHAEANYNFGVMLEAQGEWDEAEARYRRALTVKPGHARGQLNLGNVLLKQHRLADAVACYRRALELKPDDALTLRNLAIALQAQGDLGDALDAAAHALLIDATDEAKELFVRCAKAIPHSANIGRLRSAVVRALSDGWCDPASFVDLSVKLLEWTPVISECVKRANAAWPGHLPALELFGPSGLAVICGDELLRAVLESIHIPGVALERFLTAVRRAMLDLAASTFRSGNVDNQVLGFHCALAKQCFINEYVYDLRDDELNLARLMRDALAAALASGAIVPPAWLPSVAAYFPLHDIPAAETLLDRSWPAPVSALLDLQVRQPLEERDIAPTIPRLTVIDNEVSLLVQRQYEQNPYPRWIRLSRPPDPVAPDSWLRRTFASVSWPELADRNSLDILVAGCGTGRHSIESARQTTQTQVLAVDLSLSSLCYAKRQTRALGVSNVEYAQADILKLGSIGRTFDVIESVGVLHHLADPMEGWRVLLSLLRPGGLMRLGFYSELARRAVVAARTFIAGRGYGRSADDIRRCRQELLASKDPALGWLVHARDFYSISECRDMLFHVQEHRLTLPQVRTFLAGNDLRFVGFNVDAEVVKKFRQRFPNGADLIDLEAWHVFETENPDTFANMYQFWIQKGNDRPIA